MYPFFFIFQYLCWVIISWNFTGIK